MQLKPKSTFWLATIAIVLVLGTPPLLKSCATVEPPEPAVKVGLWARFEAAVVNPKRYADPYNDVTLEVTYTRPDGSEVDFWGFYDDGDTWKLRFMPDQLGVWQFDASFSDGTRGVRGAFEVVPSDVPGMLSKDALNPIWFGFEGGRHVLIRSFHAGPLFDYGWDDPDDPHDGEKREAFLDWAQAQRYNTFSSRSYFSMPEQKRSGPKLWPLDAREYRKLEAVLDELARRRMMVHGFAGFFGYETRFPDEPAAQTSYIRYVLARLGPYWNQLWNVAGPEPNRTKHLASDEVERLGEEINALDVFDHPLGVHNKDGDDPYRDADWTSYVTLQDEITDLGELSEYLLRNHTGDKPVYAHETIWLGNTLQPEWTLTDLRKQMWVHMLSATAFNVGDMEGKSTSGFSGSLDLDDKVQARHDVPIMVWDFMETLPFYRMSPRQDLLLRSRAYLLAEEGWHYLAYLPGGGSVNIAVTALGAPYQVIWINARDPMNDQRAAGKTVNGQRLTAPEAGDWLVYLRGAKSTETWLQAPR
jgi:hypothetical protein